MSSSIRPIASSIRNTVYVVVHVRDNDVQAASNAVDGDVATGYETGQRLGFETSTALFLFDTPVPLAKWAALRSCTIFAIALRSAKTRELGGKLKEDCISNT